jgi:hypothetical protein
MEIFKSKTTGELGFTKDGKTVISDRETVRAVKKERKELLGKALVAILSNLTVGDIEYRKSIARKVSNLV